MKDIFYMQRNDRRVMAVALVVMIAAIGAVTYIGSRYDTTPMAAADSLKAVPEGRKTYGKKHETPRYYYTEGRQTELFPFDPNKADSTELLRLGLQEWQVRSIYKYRAKGGIYRRKEDFARLYGLTAGQYKALEPYIRISDDYRPASEIVKPVAADLHIRDTVKYPLKLKPGEHIDLNKADSAMLVRVPGIGPAYARAISSYRKRLGGYYSAEQLHEIDGFPEEALQYFTIGSEPERNIKINIMSVGQLRRHPYIGFYQAKTIVDHRRLRGKIQSLDDLKMYRDFPPETIERLKHYVQF